MELGSPRVSGRRASRRHDTTRTSTQSFRMNRWSIADVCRLEMRTWSTAGRWVAQLNTSTSYQSSLLLLTFSGPAHLPCSCQSSLVLLTFSAPISLLCSYQSSLLLLTFSAPISLLCSYQSSLLLSVFSAPVSLLSGGTYADTHHTRARTHARTHVPVPNLLAHENTTQNWNAVIRYRH